MKTKVVIFDFEGTLTVSKTSMWARIWERIDALDVDEKLVEMYFNNEIDYETWVRLGYENFKERNFTEQVMDQLMDEIQLIENAENVFRFLKENDIKIYILSGGIKIAIEKVLKDLKHYVKQIEATNMIFNSNGELCGYTVPHHNPENKFEYVSEVIANEQVNPKEILYVGNSRNDETVYKTGVNTLCLNPHKANYENKEIWHNTIKTNNLEEILPYISC